MCFPCITATVIPVFLATVYVATKDWILNEGRLYSSPHYICITSWYLLLLFNVSLSLWAHFFFEGLASQAREPSKLLIDSQGIFVWAHLTTKLSNAAQMASNILLKVIIHFNVAAAWPVEGCSSPFSDCLWTVKSYLCPPADSQQSTLYSRLRVKGMNAHHQIEQRREDFIPGTSVRYEPTIWSAEITIPNKSCHLPQSHNDWKKILQTLYFFQAQYLLHLLFCSLGRFLLAWKKLHLCHWHLLEKWMSSLKVKYFNLTWLLSSRHSVCSGIV